jgi:ATP-dependent helicase/nuclease subunit B
LFVARCALICSRSNGQLAGRAAAFLRDHSGRSEVVVVALTRAAANELALSAFPHGCRGVHALTLIQLAASLAAEATARQALAPISRLGMEALCARIVHAARRAQSLPYFSPVAQTPGFARALAKTLAELRLQGVDVRMLSRAGAPGGDLAHLMQLYEQQLEQRSLADLPLLLRLAAGRAAEDRHRFTGLPLVLLDVTIESRSEEQLIAALVEKSPAVLAASVPGGEGSLKALEAVLGAPAENLDEPAAGTTLDRIRAGLFSNEPLPAGPPDPQLLFSAPGESLECVEIARRIQALAREGTEFDRIAILLRNVEQYQPLLEEALRRARIPGYFSRGVARPDPAGRAFLALLSCAGEGCSASRFAEYLSLGQLPEVDESGAPKKRAPLWLPPGDEILANFSVPPPGGELEAEASETTDGNGHESTLAVPIGWEKLLVDAAVIGGRDRWARRLRGLRAEFEAQLRELENDDESHRPHIERRIEQLTRLEHFALPLIETLGTLPATANWGDWLAALSALAQTVLRRPEFVLSVLSELEPMGAVGPASLDEVYEVLSERLGRLRTEPARRRYGAVFVGSIEEARGRSFDVVFLPGLAEGLFPRRALEDPLLLDEHRGAIAAHLDRQADRIARERRLLRSAAAAASIRLVISYPRMDVAQARARVPSFYALEVVRAAEGRLPSLQEFEKRAAGSAPARLDWPAPVDPSVAIDDAEYDLASLRRARTAGSARYLMETNPHLARSFRSRWMRWEKRWSYADGLVNPDERALDFLATQLLSKRSYSPSSLQQFAACPYRFLLQGIFQFRPREVPAALEQMDPLTRGALFHAVQFELFREFAAAELLPVSSDALPRALDLADGVMDRVAARFEEELAPAIPRVWKSQVESLRTDLRGWLQQSASGSPEWTPIHFEFAFGLGPDPRRDPESVRQEAVILDGIHLRGSIDLIERHVERDILRVTDHKTGKAPQSHPRSVGGGAILQPVLYALAAQGLLGQAVECGRLFYCTQRGDFLQIDVPLNDESRYQVERVLDTINRSIEEGFLPAAPQSGACALCDYSCVCGPYEEQRVKRKPQERLAALIEVRGLP